MIALGIIWFSIVLILDVRDDYRKWEQNIPVVHWKEAILRSLFLIPSTIFLTLPFPLDFWKMVIVIAMEAFTYLLLFDGWYNINRNQNWWFLGTVDKDDALWDKIQRKIPLPLLKILKIGIPIMLLIIYIIYDNL